MRGIIVIKITFFQFIIYISLLKIYWSNKKVKKSQKSLL